MSWPLMDKVSLEQQRYMPLWWARRVRKDTGTLDPLEGIEVVESWAEKIAAAKEAREAGRYMRSGQ